MARSLLLVLLTALVRSDDPTKMSDVDFLASGYNSTALAGSDDPTKMPNIDYVASGYNIYYGSPHTTRAGVDPGFNTNAGSPIFTQSYKSGGTTGDGRYLVPDGFTIRSNHGCELSFTSMATFKSSEFMKFMKIAVTAEFGGFGASFTASTDYSSFHEHTANSSMKSVSSVAECSVYNSKVNPYLLPEYSDGFKAAIASMPSDYGDGEAFFDFMDTFGTHAVKNVQMGSRFGFNSYFTEEHWTDVVKTDVNVSVAAKYEGIVTAGGSVDSDNKRKQQQAFDQNMMDYNMITLGTKPTRGDSTAWAQQVVTEPMPISYELMTICKVITDAKVKANCETSLTASEYCTKRVLGRGDVTSCDAPADHNCLWSSDCGPAQECVHNICVAPTGTGQVQGVNRYFHGNYNTFHFPPAWGGEQPSSDTIFYALKKSVMGAVPINRYCNGHDSTFHPSPPWGSETNCGDAIFFAFKQQQPGTVPINRYWDDSRSWSTFHPAPEWPNEHDSGDDIFFAYTAPASCAAHSACSINGNGGDCCPTAQGNWLRCCDQSDTVSESGLLFV